MWLRRFSASVEKTDGMLGRLRSLIESMHLADSTTIFLTADHGGLGKRHGGLTMSETEIPWIVVGPAIRKDHEIADQIMQYDTAATLAYILNIKASPCWRGRPVISAIK